MKFILYLSFFAVLLAIAGCIGQEKMTLDKARAIAQASDCMDAGNLTNVSAFNNNSKTWWINLDTIKPGCSPACVVYENQSAEVNWRCTGIIIPNETEYCSKSCHISIGQINYTESPPTCTESDSPIACTMEYRFGDVCLKYLECSSGSLCSMTIDPKFYECVACFENETIEGPLFNSSCENKYQAE